MKCVEINDENMYRYFDRLVYDENSELKKWPKSQRAAGFGLRGFDIYSMLGSKELLYGREDAEQQICLLDAMQKFLREYIPIEGVDKLLVNNYGTIENSIFFEHDKSGNPVKIREHAKHQMKNAYLGSIMLLDFGYVKDIAENIYEAESSITQYLLQQAVEVLKEGKKDFAPSRQVVLEQLEGWSYKIFMLSSMMHDIGYPLEFYLRSAKHLTEFPPYLKMLSPTVKIPFSEIKVLLLDSQLFQQINHEQIREKYEKDNHGVLSAISFLMHFYYGGKIHSLNREEKCIVEMSAIAIYRHTDKLTDYSRMVYRHDPISYFVRLCDDLQEWERFLVQISNKHNYLQCNHCGKILSENNREYVCTCGRSYTKITQINNRKVNYICLCDSLVLEKDKYSLKITLKFNLMKQIEILLDDYTAVLKRQEDLEKVKTLVEDQNIKLPIQIDYFLSNNPLFIIERMISESEKSEEEIKILIEQMSSSPRKNNLQKFFYEYLNIKKKENYFGGKLNKNRLRYGEIVRRYVKEYFGEIYSLSEILEENQN